MEQAAFSGVRVLIVGARGYAASTLRTVLTAAGIIRIASIEEPRRALELLCTEAFDAVFVEEQAALDGAPFALAARRSKAILNPMIPIFAVYSGARRRDVETSRDLGVHDVLVRPISPKTIMEKLNAAFAMPRPFIAAPEFFGPDRRSKKREDGPFGGKDRRTRTPRKTKVHFIDI